jgi:hypothetical protein
MHIPYRISVPGILPLQERGKYGKLPSCSACRPAGRMAIQTMEAKGFHSKLPSCSACRPAGRMAIQTMEVKLRNREVFL